MLTQEILGFAGAILMGLSLGLIGGGGSILSVPIFVYLFSIPPGLATAYSLFVVGVASLIGGIQYFKNKLVDFRAGILFAVPSFLGVFLVRRFVMPELPEVLFSFETFIFSKDSLIMLTFAILMLVASFSMIRPQKTSKKKWLQISPQMKGLFIGLEGLVVGGITGFVGAGGGFLIIPALVLLVGLEMKVAIGTSLFIIAIKSLFGFVGDVSVQTGIHWMFLYKFTAISILGILIGSVLSNKINGDKLKVGFGWFVLIMGIFILLKSLI